MKISCPSCSAKYSIGDDKVRDRLAKIRCRKCGATIVIDGKVDPPHVHTADGDGGGAIEDGTSAEASYSVDLGGGEPRTMTLTELTTAYAAGDVNAQTFVWAEGFADWKPLSDVPEIVGALHGGAAAAAPPWEASKKASAAPRAAARGGRTGGSDLFGGYAQAGSEADVTTSAPEPAIGATAASATGARNESSVLFSLSALTASSPSSPAPAASSFSVPAAAASGHDSGLIDLKALAEQAPPAGATAASPLGSAPLGGAPLATSPLMNAPLGMAAPLGGHAAQAAAIAIPDYPQRRSNTGMIIGVIGVLVGIVAIVVVVSQSGKQPEPVAAPTASVVYIEKTVTVPREDDEEDAKPPATGDSAEEEAPAATATATATAKATRPRTTTTKPKTTTGGSTSTAPAATATAKPKKSGCGCAPGDLQCAMRCAAK